MNLRNIVFCSFLFIFQSINNTSFAGPASDILKIVVKHIAGDVTMDFLKSSFKNKNANKNNNRSTKKKNHAQKKHRVRNYS